MEPEIAYVCLIKTSKHLGLLMTRPDPNNQNVVSIHGFKTETEGIRYFESGYNAAHGWVSACLNNIFFQPSILQLAIDSIKGHLPPQPQTVVVSNVSGRMTLLPLVNAEELWESGVKPQLIS